jgi:hypothetical protein
MARDKRGGGPAAADAADADDDPDLQSEVRAFAASLGFSGGGAGGGAGGGFAFDDFAPPPTAAAKKGSSRGEKDDAVAATTDRRAKPDSSSKKKHHHSKQKEAGGDDDNDPKAANNGRPAPPTPPQQQRPDPRARDPIRERGWNSGAGPRPASLFDSASRPSGGSPARSALPKDDPAVWHEAQLPALAPPPAALAAAALAAASRPAHWPDPDDPSLDAKRRKELRRLERRRVKQQQGGGGGGGGGGAGAAGAASSQPLALDDDSAERLRQRADALLEAEAAAYEQALGRRSAGDARWLQQVRRSGTTADRVAAMTLLVQVRIWFLGLFFPSAADALPPKNNTTTKGPHTLARRAGTFLCPRSRRRANLRVPTSVGVARVSPRALRVVSFWPPRAN